MPSFGGKDYLINSQYFRVQVFNNDKGRRTFPSYRWADQDAQSIKQSFVSFCR